MGGWELLVFIIGIIGIYGTGEEGGGRNLPKAFQRVVCRDRTQMLGLELHVNTPLPPATAPDGKAGACSCAEWVSTEVSSVGLWWPVTALSSIASVSLHRGLLLLPGQ